MPRIDHICSSGYDGVCCDDCAPRCSHDDCVGRPIRPRNERVQNEARFNASRARDVRYYTVAQIEDDARFMNDEHDYAGMTSLQRTAFRAQRRAEENERLESERAIAAAEVTYMERSEDMPREIMMPWMRAFGIEIECRENFDSVGDLADQLSDELTRMSGHRISVAGDDDDEYSDDGDERASDNNAITLSNGWGVCYDGSCGYEVKSPILSGSVGLASVAMMMRAMRAVGCRVDSQCGIHIHVDTRDMRRNGRAIANLAAMVGHVENMIFAMTNRSREGNTYCRRLTSILHGVASSSSLDDAMIHWYGLCRDYGGTQTGLLQSANQLRNIHYHDTRYHGANMHSVFYRGTIEFRYFNSTLRNEDLVKSWIVFCVATTEYAARATRVRWPARNARAMSPLGNRGIVKAFNRIMNVFARGTVLGSFPMDAAHTLAERIGLRTGLDVANPLGPNAVIAREQVSLFANDSE